MTPVLAKYISSWIEIADRDLQSAERLISIKPSILDTACFHCQQAVEKYLKAFLIYRGKDVERTHNIIRLLAQCAEFDRQFGVIDPGNIDAYAVHIRYPDQAEIPELKEAKKHLALARKIRKIVIKKIDLTGDDELKTSSQK